MGFSLSWIALPPSEVSAALAELRFTAEDEYSASEDWRYNLTHVSESWSLIHASRCDFAPAAPLPALSRNCNLYAFYAEEHVMVSGISAWHMGAEQWGIDHDPSQGIDHLDISGTIPDVVATAQSDRKSKQAQAAPDIPVDHIFSIAIDVGEQLVGYRHDRYVAGARRFQQLSRDKRWWEFWR